MRSLAYFLAQRIHGSRPEGKRVSPPAIRIAIAGIAVGLTVMMLSVAIVVGFKRQIREMVIGFGSHVQVTNIASSTSYESHPIALSDSLYQALRNDERIADIARVATKPAVLKTDSSFLTVVIKGVDAQYDWEFFKNHLLAGETLALSDSIRSNDVVISQYIADKLEIGVGDAFVSYFIEDGARVRKFRVAGVYQTNFTEFDQLFVLGDLRHIQRLNHWHPDQVSMLELRLKDYQDLEAFADEYYYLFDGKKDPYQAQYFVQTIRDVNPQVFSWLDLLDLNVWVILVLMSLVATFTVISGLLIIILERTSMIGLLKSLGYANWEIRKVFLYVASFLVLKGMLWGNLLTLTFVYIQSTWGVLKLDPVNYYLDKVPVELNFLHVALINLATMLISLLVLVGPTYIITRIQPSKSIKFD